MDPKQVILVAVALVALVAIVWVLVRRERTNKLRKRFGPEYDRAVRENGTQRAEAALLQREKRAQSFSLRELSSEEREGLVTEWRLVQLHFVDDPQAAVSEAERLVDHLMESCGYPISDFEQQAADISVDHPHVVDNYRAAHQIAMRHRQDQASTEDLRNAMICYRSLFDELLQSKTTAIKSEVA